MTVNADLSHALCCVVTRVPPARLLGVSLIVWGTLALLNLSRPSQLLAEEVVSCVNQRSLSQPDSQAVLLKLQDRYREVKSIEAEFLQSSYLAALEVSESSSGKVAFSRPAKMRWDYQEPEPQIFLFVENTIWFYQKSQNQVLIDKAEQVLLSDLPLAFLMGIGDLSRDFSIVKACSRSEGFVLELEPKKGGTQSTTSEEGERGLKGFQILVDRDQSLPAGARVVDLNSNITTVLMRNLVVNQEVDSKFFEPQFPKGTDIQDRRKLDEEK